MGRKSNLDKKVQAVFQIFVIIVVLAAIAYAYRQQIISWIEKAIISTLQALFKFAVFFLIPFIFGILLGKYLLDNQSISTTQSFWVAIILCIVGLLVLGNITIGYGIGTALASFILGIMAYLIYGATKDGL